MIKVTRQPETFVIEISGDDLSYLQGISSMPEEVVKAVYANKYMIGYQADATATLRALNTAIVEARRA